MCMDMCFSMVSIVCLIEIPKANTLAQGIMVSWLLEVATRMTGTVPLAGPKFSKKDILLLKIERDFGKKALLDQREFTRRVRSGFWLLRIGLGGLYIIIHLQHSSTLYNF